jgi:hypothetical protein
VNGMVMVACGDYASTGSYGTFPQLHSKQRKNDSTRTQTVIPNGKR